MQDLTHQSASDLLAALSAGRISATEIMRAFLTRIEAVNGKVNALVSMRPHEDLLAEAAAAPRPCAAKPLAGLPIAVKDLVATKGLRTTYGSPIYADFVPDQDDWVAARLRSAGAIIIGKTNTPEWGHGSNTFNPVHGATANPYDLTRTSGGSSGGAAAALAARMLPLADGSDMMGSLRNPAAFCNVYGMRPSWGLVPADAGGEAFLHTLATDGPMARSPQDLALLLSVLAAPNPEVPFCRPGQDFSADLGMTLKGMRIGWLADWGGAYACEPGILALCETGLDLMENLGARIEALEPPFPAEQLWQCWLHLRAGPNAHAKRDLIEDPAKRDQTKPETLWEIEQGRSLGLADFYAASEIRSKWFATAARLFADFDALVLPTAQVWPFPLDWRWPQQINGQALDTYHRWMEVVVPASLAGLPCLNLPVGFSKDGLPMGMQVFGSVGADAKLLGIGQAYHLASDWPGRHPAAL